MHSTFHELLIVDIVPFENHNPNLQFRVTEMYKLAKCISPTIMKEICRVENNRSYNLKSQNTFKIPFRNSIYISTEFISHFGTKLWELVPGNLESITSLSNFKEQIKKWNPENSLWRL